MAIENLSSILSASATYSVRTDSSADWSSVATNTYFYDKATKAVYYKNADGHVSIITTTPVKQNLSATTDPTVNDDIGDFYSQGSFWYNTSTDKLWVCMVNTLGAALWKLLTLTDNTGNIVIPGGLQFGGGFASGAITTNTNDFVIPNLATSILVRLSSTANLDITGIVVPDNTKSFFFNIFNINPQAPTPGSFSITFKNQNAGSVAQNRFLLGGDVNIQPGEGITLLYDPVDLRWRSPGKNI